MFDPPFAPSSGTTPLSPMPGPYTFSSSGRRRNSSPATSVAGLGAPPPRPYAARWASRVTGPTSTSSSADRDETHRERSGLGGLVRTASVPAMHAHAMAAKSVVYTSSAVIVAYPPDTAAYESRQQFETLQEHPQQEVQQMSQPSHSPAERYAASVQRPIRGTYPPRSPSPITLRPSSPALAGGTFSRHPNQLPKIQVPPLSASLTVVASSSPSPNASAFPTRSTLMLHRRPRSPSGSSASPPTSATRPPSIYGLSRSQSCYGAVPLSPASAVSSPAMTVRTHESGRSGASGLTFGKARNSLSEV